MYDPDTILVRLDGILGSKRQTERGLGSLEDCPWAAQAGGVRMNLDDAINVFVEERMIPIFGIASAEGFADALLGWHPSER